MRSIFMKKIIFKVIFILCTLFFHIQNAYSDTYAYSYYQNVSPNKTAQALFNKGMLNYYGYLYIQAEYTFRQALIYDPDCAMCYWGLAIAKKHQALELGQAFSKVGFDEINKASTLVNPENEFQFDVVQAAMNSFSLNKHDTNNALQLGYINALRNLYQKYKDNREWREESLALFVDAIAYYSNADEGDGMANHCGRLLNNNLRHEAVNLMSSVLSNESYQDHPGLIHTYIHMTERDLTNPLSITAAKKLPHFSQGEIAHYTHMANHIFWRRGMFDEAIKANHDAIAIDNEYFKHHGAGLNSYYYEYHYLHSYQFLTVLGVLTNNFKLAIENAKSIKNLMDVNRIENLKDFRDIYLTLEHLVLVRFDKWQEVLELKAPLQINELGELFIQFSRAIAHINLDDQKQFQKIYNQIKLKKYQRTQMQDIQLLILNYLQATDMKLHNKSLAEIKRIFIKNHVDKIENKLYVMNPPIWFFSHQLFLSDMAFAKGDMQAARQYHDLYEKMYPHSTLGLWSHHS